MVVKALVADPSDGGAQVHVGRVAGRLELAQERSRQVRGSSRILLCSRQVPVVRAATQQPSLTQLQPPPVTKLIDSRPSSHSDIDTALAGLTSTQRDFSTTFSASAAVALKELEQATTQGRADRERAEHLSAEFARLRRLMAEHTAETAREGEGG